MRFHSFCAANSGDGFVSFFDTLTDERQRQVFYIKGGPGCGKSTLMRSLAEMDNTAEMIHCSGDPDSLDGIILPSKKIVIMDATAPHSHEPKYPCVGGTIIDLGIIWDRYKLNKEHIIDLTEQKSELYRNCYNLLKSIKNIHSGVFIPLKQQLNMKRIKSISNKILLQNALSESNKAVAHVEKRFLGGITPKGLLTYSNTITDFCKNIIVIDDRWMLSDLMLQYLHNQLNIRGIDHINAYHPLLGKNTLHHIIVPTASFAIVTHDGLFPIEISENCITRRISLQNLLDKDEIEKNRVKLQFMKRLMRELLKDVVTRLEVIKGVHAEIEKEYAIGSDFSKVNMIMDNLKKNLFG